MKYLKMVESRKLVEAHQDKMKELDLAKISDFITNNVEKLIHVTQNTAFYFKIVPALEIACLQNDSQFSKASSKIKHFGDSHGLVKEASQFIEILNQFRDLVGNNIGVVISGLKGLDEDPVNFKQTVRCILEEYLPELRDRFEDEKVSKLLHKQMIKEGKAMRQGKITKMEERESYKTFQKTFFPRPELK